MQYNKVDLRNKGEDSIPTKILQQDLNSVLRVPAFEASALGGGNVMKTLKKIISMTLASIQDQLF
jgi:hypothetical protein